MTDVNFALLERVATLEAQNTELMGIIQYVINSAPEEKPTRFSLRKGFEYWMKFYKVGQVIKQRMEWITRNQGY